jgi:hypothetical protein
MFWTLLPFFNKITNSDILQASSSYCCQFNVVRTCSKSAPQVDHGTSGTTLVMDVVLLFCRLIEFSF